MPEDEATLHRDLRDRAEADTDVKIMPMGRVLTEQLPHRPPPITTCIVTALLGTSWTDQNVYLSMTSFRSPFVFRRHHVENAP